MTTFTLKPYFNLSQSRWLLLSFFILILDQLIKYSASHSLVLYQPRPLMPYLSLTLAHNTGAAFSVLAHTGHGGVWFLIAFAATMSLFLGAWLLHLSKQQYWLSAAIALVLGGALGNLLDRILYGYVVDFIDVYYGSWHWPAFNFADSAISIGIIMLILASINTSGRATPVSRK